MPSLNGKSSNKKLGEWEPIARGAADARDKIRKADFIAADLLEKTRHWCDYDWVSISSVETTVKQVRQLLAAASTDLTLGLKGRGKSRGSVVK